MSAPSFAESLLVCDDGTSVRREGGNRFIRKLPDARPLAYLHKLYKPLDDTEISKLCEALGRRLPLSFEEFLRWSNGASLFDNNLLIFGHVESIDRSLSLDSQQPISLASMDFEFSVEQRARWSSGWFNVGSIIGWDKNHRIELNADGRCMLTSGTNTFADRSLDRCLSAIVDRMDTCFSCDGIVDRSRAELEAAVASLFHPQ